MTIASSSTAELSINQIVVQACRLASLMPLEQSGTGIQWERRATAARQFLEMIIKGLEVEGRLLRARRFYRFALTPGTSDYTMPGEILDVFSKAAYIPASEPDPDHPTTELVVQQIAMEEWQSLGSRGITATPNMYMVERATEAITLRIWPTPNEAGSLRVQAYYLFANATDGAATPDLERYWAQYLTEALAAKLAEATSQSGDKIQRLKADAAISLLKAKGYSRERTGFRVAVRHQGPWR